MTRRRGGGLGARRCARAAGAGVLLAAALTGCGEEFSAGTGSGGTSSGSGGIGGAGGTGGMGASGGTGGAATGGKGGGSAAAAGAAGQAGEAGAPGTCETRTRSLAAVDAVSLDYGPEPRDPPTVNPLDLSTGLGHEHEHDYVTWLKFDLRDVPQGAVPKALTLTVHCLSVVGADPPLGLVYSSGDAWTSTSATVDTIEVVPRTQALGGDAELKLGSIRLSVDLDRYISYWSDDLADGAFTLGVTIVSSTLAPEVYGTLAPPGELGVEPVLEVVTCE